MVRIVIRFRKSRPFSFTPVRGVEEELRHFLRLLPRDEILAVEEQIYTPEHPKAFVYRPREDLLELARRLWAEMGEEG